MSILNNKQSVSRPYSDSVLVNNFLFISGQIGINKSTGKLVTADFEREAIQVMENIKSLLDKENLTFSDLVSVTIYLKTMDHYQLLNNIYASFFEDEFPARVCIAVADLPLNAQVEIAATAAIRS